MAANRQGLLELWLLRSHQAFVSQWVEILSKATVHEKISRQNILGNPSWIKKCFISKKYTTAKHGT